MRVLIRSAALLATAVSLAACGGAAPTALPMRAAAANVSSSTPGIPVAGSRAEAAALAKLMLSRLRLPIGARRLAPSPVPQSVSEPSLWGGAVAAVDVHELFQLSEPMATAAANLGADVPAGMSLAVTGQGSGPGGPASADVAYAERSVPAGVNSAQLVLTIAPEASDASLVRADAQVIYYPPRTAAEYIDPARYRVLTITATIFNPQVHTVRVLVTSRAAIRQLASSLNRSEVQPTSTAFCADIFAMYRLSFALTRDAAPAIVVTATRWPCLGAMITVDGRKQPALQDDGAVVAIADRLLGVTPKP